MARSPSEFRIPSSTPPLTEAFPWSTADSPGIAPPDVPVSAARQGPGSALVPWIAAFALGACAVLAFAVPGVLGVGGRWSAAAGAVVAAALLVMLAVLRRQYKTNGTSEAGSDLRVEQWQRYAEELERRVDARRVQDSATESALAQAFDRLMNVQIPAALNGSGSPGAFTDHRAIGRTEVAVLCDRAADAVAEGAAAVREQLDGQIESHRLAVVTLARRVQASAHRIQEQATRMANRHPGDSDVLESSMLVDHAAAQQARHAQSVAVLCGEWPGQQWPQPLALLDVARAAAGRIVAYQRVAVSGEPDVAATAVAVEPLIHLIAELLANATQSSPPTTQVLVTVRTVQRGAVIEIDDGGVGLEEHQLEQAREIVSGRRLLGLGDLGEVPQTGMAVIGQYVRRHGFGVDLMPSPYGGVRAIVLVHAHMVENLEPASAPPPQLSAPAKQPEAVGPRPGSLPQRRSRREESERGDDHENLPSGEATAPAQTPEQAGAWLAAYLGPQASEHEEVGATPLMPPLPTGPGIAPDTGVAPPAPRSWDSLGDTNDGPGNEQA